MTGLTPDLIRAWEKRYRVVAPVRGARGARLYSANDIAHLRLLARVVGAGRAIGDVAALGRAKLEKLAAQLPPDMQEVARRDADSPREGPITRILEHLARFDDTGMTRLLGDALLGLGARSFVHEVAVPLMHRVGERWAGGHLSIAEEHLLTATLRTLLAELARTRPAHGSPIVLATPAGERHEIGLLLVALLAREAGADVVYLGVDLPAADIVAAATRARARVVGLSLVASENRARAVVEVNAVQVALAGKCDLWLGGADAGEVAAGIDPFLGLVFDTLEGAEVELARLTASIPRAR
jgi:DNA-binding transcriptional MerR regulator/methylmalonyl-CoA mutase cobalamin-binding subunit